MLNCSDACKTKTVTVRKSEELENPVGIFVSFFQLSKVSSFKTLW